MIVRQGSNFRFAAPLAGRRVALVSHVGGRPRFKVIGLGDVLTDAQNLLVQAGYAGAQCRTERVALPMADPSTGKTFYEQNICSAPGFGDGFMAEAVLNSTLAHPGTGVDLNAQRVYALAHGGGDDASYFQNLGAGSQVVRTTDAPGALLAGPYSALANTPPATTYTTPATYPVTASLRNLSGAGGFRVGDRWELTITGRPNSLVTVVASHNGETSNANFGSTDASGRRVLTGQFDAGTVGSWQQVWSVAGQNATVTFSVVPVGAPSSGSGTNTSSGSNTGSNNQTSLPSVLDGSFQVAGMNIPYWAAGAAAVGAFLFMGGKR